MAFGRFDVCLKGRPGGNRRPPAVGGVAPAGAEGCPSLGPGPAPAEGAVKADLAGVERLGSSEIYHLRVGRTELKAVVNDQVDGETFHLELGREEALLFDGEGELVE